MGTWGRYYVDALETVADLELDPASAVVKAAIGAAQGDVSRATRRHLQQAWAQE